MAHAEQERRARFLYDAAHLLVLASPAAAAFLGSARDRVVQEADLDIPPKEYDAYRRAICGACGNVMVPGWSCAVSIRSRLKGAASKRNGCTKAAATPETQMARKCLRCHRDTLQTLPPKPRRNSKQSKARAEPPSAPEATSSRREVGSAAVKTANATSKQRQRARKGGLQAMLEKSKSQNTGLGGLDLMDFAM